MKQWVGPYRLIRKLGSTGPSAVFLAEDARLGRRVALKTLPRGGSDLAARERLLREARMAASVPHPRICQIHEVGEAEGDLFVAMELLEGESLEQRLVRVGSLPVGEAARIGLDLLAALDHLHRHGLVHRGLRPSSIFLTADGQKLLDFALARPPDADAPVPDRLAAPPTAGAYEYMAPELLQGRGCDARADIWAAGAILYTALVGRPPFGGAFEDVREATRLDQAPPLSGVEGVELLDRVVARALQPDARHRHPSAAEMAADIQVALDALEGDTTARASRVTRLIVLPFRLLRPDPDIEFLAVSLADAIGTSISAPGSVIVRSSLAVSSPAETLDLREVAVRHEVDVVVTGTIVRAGGQVRVGVQLLEVPVGTLLWSQTRQVPFDQLFDLQDELAGGVAQSLTVPLTAREHRRVTHDVPAAPEAYEHYLRANQLAHDSARWHDARALYEACVAIDPQYAPAWARLGRTYRVLAKYGLVDDPEITFLKADAALKRALELNPDLPLANSLQAAFEVDTGRVEHALRRLLTLAATRRADVSLRVALVQACRFCGLLEASAAAHAAARRLDPRTPTSVMHTWWAMGDYARVLDGPERGTDPIAGLTMATVGRTDDAVGLLKSEELRFVNRGMRAFSRMLRLALEGDRASALGLADELETLVVQDPEALYYVSRTRAWLRDDDRALAGIDRAVHLGYFVSRVLVGDPWLATLRSHPGFPEIVHRAREREARAAAAFCEAGGEALLGVTVNP